MASSLVYPSNDRKWLVTECLAMQIESGLYNRQARNQKGNVTNFSKLLPDNQSDLADNTLKVPYLFDFLNLGKRFM